jgi:hypothetical protein
MSALAFDAAVKRRVAPAELGHTRIRLPFGGCASNVPGEIRKPKFLPFAFLIGGIVFGTVCFISVRMLLW